MHCAQGGVWGGGAGCVHVEFGVPIWARLWGSFGVLRASMGVYGFLWVSTGPGWFWVPPPDGVANGGARGPGWALWFCPPRIQQILPPQNMMNSTPQNMMNSTPQNMMNSTLAAGICISRDMHIPAALLEKRVWSRICLFWDMREDHIIPRSPGVGQGCGPPRTPKMPKWRSGNPGPDFTHG